MLTTLLAAQLFLAPQVQVLWKRVTLPMPAHSNTVLLYQTPVDPLDEPKKSPKTFGEDKQHWAFPWCFQGCAQPSGLATFRPFFNVYAQEHKDSGDKAPMVTTMLLRLWDLNYEKLRLSHSPKYQGGMVDVYLCYGGEAGGEQLFDMDKVRNLKTEKDEEVPVNTIYIYNMPSFTDPVEMAREVAHEYGHATLIPIGGYKEPEDWANGYLGEKLYLRWMRDAMTRGELSPEDTMGATKEGLDKWVKKNVDPLVEKSAQTLPTEKVMSDTSAAGMDEYIGLALYIDTIFPDSVFARSTKIVGSYDAKDYPQAILLAVEEPPMTKLNIPANLYGKLIWIPVGTGRLSGAKVVKKDPSGWVQIKADAQPVFLYSTYK